MWIPTGVKRARSDVTTRAHYWTPFGDVTGLNVDQTLSFEPSVRRRRTVRDLEVRRESLRGLVESLPVSFVSVPELGNDGAVEATKGLQNPGEIDLAVIDLDSPRRR